MLKIFACVLELVNFLPSCVCVCVVPVPVIKEKIGCTEPNISGALDWGEQEHGYQTNKKLTRKRTQKTVKRHHKKHLCRLVENRPTQKKNSKYNSIVLYTAPTLNTTLAVNIKLWIFFYWEKPFQIYCFYKNPRKLAKIQTNSNTRDIIPHRLYNINNTSQ